MSVNHLAPYEESRVVGGAWEGWLHDAQDNGSIDMYQQHLHALRSIVFMRSLATMSQGRRPLLHLCVRSRNLSSSIIAHSLKRFKHDH